MQARDKFNMGRPVSKNTLKVRQAVIRAMRKPGNDRMTVAELARITRQKKYSILLAMRFFEAQGYVVRDGTKKTTDSSGRPSVVWKKV